ncbi:MAG: hypothetical protein IAG13_22565 [Deltaproteobacteria bacterium]|nr:hypothetical protein [Nannocystaceae bacterium]
MIRISRGLAALVYAGVPACEFDPSGQGSTSAATFASTSPSSEDDSGSSAVTGSEGDGGSSHGESDSGGACMPGNVGCPCDAGACFDVLTCMGNVCVVPSCPNAIVEIGEACDDGNGIDDDGCDIDCKASSGVARVALGIEHTCVVLHGGEVRCWGNGTHGKTGHGDPATIGDMLPASSSETLVLPGPVDRVALAVDSSCALLRDGTITCWGNVAEGRLGYGPAVVEDVGDTEPAGSAGAVDIGGAAIDVALGAAHTCAVRDDGRVLCWGSGASGRLGSGSTMSIGLAQRPVDVPAVDLGALAATRVVAGLAHTCALLANQEVRCWGESESGILGDPSFTQDFGDDPDEVPAAGASVQLGGPATAIDAGNQHTCALLANSTVRCWGFGNAGRLGLGSNDNIGDDETPADHAVQLGGNALQIVAGRAHTCAVRDDNALVCWGTGNSGKLGTGANDDLGDVPEQVPSMLVPVVVHDEAGVALLAVDAGGDHTCARLTGGRLRCWGEADQGQLGYGNEDDIGGPMRSILQAGDVPVGFP